MVLTLDFATSEDEDILSKFAYGLANNDTLLELQMRRVNGLLGIEELAETLRSRNTTLMELVLQDNNMTEEGAATLTHALELNYTMLHFHLYDTTRRARVPGSRMTTISSELDDMAQRFCARNAKLLRKKYDDAVKSDNGTAPWMRSKLMVIGQGTCRKNGKLHFLSCSVYSLELLCTGNCSCSSRPIICS